MTTKPHSNAETLEPCPWCKAVPRHLADYFEVFHTPACFLSEFSGALTRKLIYPERFARWNSYTTPASAAPVVDNADLVSDVDRWKHDLLNAGWRAESAAAWRAPDGSLWRGPFGAWKELQRRIKALGLDTDWPLQDVLTQSAEWLRHLGGTHNCDCHGWEAQSFLIDAATSYAAATAAPVEQKQPLPDHYLCIAPAEQPTVVNFLRGYGSEEDRKLARLHLNLCLRCQELANAAPVEQSDEPEEAYCANCRSHHLLPLCDKPEYRSRVAITSSSKSITAAAEEIYNLDDKDFNPSMVREQKIERIKSIIESCCKE